MTLSSISVCFKFSLDTLQSFNFSKRVSHSDVTSGTRSAPFSALVENEIHSFLRTSVLDSNPDPMLHIHIKTTDFCESCTNPVWINGSKTGKFFLPTTNFLVSSCTTMIALRTQDRYRFHGHVCNPSETVTSHLALFRWRLPYCLTWLSIILTGGTVKIIEKFQRKMVKNICTALFPPNNVKRSHVFW